MPLAVYEDNTLLSVSYCTRKLRELDNKRTLSTCCGLDYTHSEKLELLDKEIYYYRHIIAELSHSWEALSDDELLNFISNEMSMKISHSNARKISILFSEVSDYDCTVKIYIYNIFTTELSLSQKPFERSYHYNEHYDGYHDLCEDVYETTATDFLRGFMAKLKDKLHSKLPGVEIKCDCA